jgi:DNA-binding beta-propeller fold protein YncE
MGERRRIGAVVVFGLSLTAASACLFGGPGSALADPRPRPGACLAGWRVGDGAAEPGSGRIVCRDGDPTCDADATADGTCSVPTALCLDLPGCETASIVDVTVAGAQARVLQPMLAALPFPITTAGSCVGPAEIRVALGGRLRARTVLRSRVAETGGRRERDRLRIECRGDAGARAVIVTTDFQTGLLRVLRTAAPRRVQAPDTPIHSDAVIRTAAGNLVVVNRFLGDNIQVLDPAQGFRTRLQCSTGVASNPHDIVAVAPDKAYVTRYGRAELWVVDPTAGGCERFRRGTIDLGAFADADGLPEMSQMAVVGDRLFVTVQRLDRGRGFAPTGPSRVVVIDTASDTVVGSIRLFGANAFGDSTGIAREPGTGRLVLATPGDIYRVGDGGLERVDPETLTAEGRFFVTEDDLGGNVTDFVLVSPAKGYAVVQDRQLRNHLVAFDPSGATPARDVLVRDGYLPDIALGPDGLLWLADMSLPTPGLHRFDPVTGRQLAPRVIDVGLPPFSIGFVP